LYNTAEVSPHFFNPQGNSSKLCTGLTTNFVWLVAVERWDTTALLQLVLSGNEYHLIDDQTTIK